MLAVEKALRASGVAPAEYFALIRSIAGRTAPPGVFPRLQGAVSRSADAGGGTLESFLLTHAALAALDRVDELPVSSAVKQRFYEAFRTFTSADRVLRMTRSGQNAFASLCGIALLERFPAGEFEWEVSGLPRSWLLRIERKALPKVALFVGKAGGFSPLVYPHLGVLRPRRIMLVEQEINRSYHRIAQSVRMQPAIRGLMASAWFFSPDTDRYSPHLGWLWRFFADNGGIVTTMGAADPEESGALSRSNKRKQLSEAGEFHPTLGLILWPRQQMLRWAAAHPEYGD
jgi:hypothetical protein